MSRYCKVCFDAGKDESVVRSHSVREGNMVICPTLLSIECKYCHQTGHTVKYCGVLKWNEKSKRRNEYDRKQFIDGSVTKSKKRKMNMFERLIDDEDDEDDEELIERETPSTLQGWAAIVAKKPETVPSPLENTSSSISNVKQRRVYDWTCCDSDSDSD